MHRRVLYCLVGVFTVFGAVCAHLAAQQPLPVRAFTDADWPRYAGDFAGTKYSRLTQINTKNVSTLVQAWTLQGVGTQQTPIVVDGVLYATTPGGAVALEADSGKLIWRYGAAPAPGGGRGGRGAPGGGRGAGGRGGPPPDADAAQDGAAPPPAGQGRGGPAPPDAAGQGGGGRGGAVPTTEGPGGAPSSRGLAYWPGDGAIPP